MSKNVSQSEGENVQRTVLVIVVMNSLLESADFDPGESF